MISSAVCTPCKLRLPEFSLPRLATSSAGLIKSYFEDITGSRAGSMKSVLQYLGLEQDGRDHSDIDYSRNTVKILCELARMNKSLRDGFVEPRVTECWSGTRI